MTQTHSRSSSGSIRHTPTRHDPNSLPPNNPLLTRKRASPSADPDEQLCPQQRYVKRPKHPGMIAFNPSLQELPLQKSKPKNRSSPSPADQPPSTQDTYIVNKTYLSDTQHNGYSSDKTIGSSPGATEGHRKTQQDTLAKEQENVAALPAHTSATPIFNQAPSSELNTTALEQATMIGLQQQFGQTGEKPSAQFARTFVYRPYLDTKLIYADLVGPKKTVAEGVAQPGFTYDSETLGRLRRSVLDTSNDFFQVSQDPNASDALRRLAFTYGMPSKWHKGGLKTFSPVLEMTLDMAQNEMLSFIDRARNLLDVLDKKFCSVRQDWGRINNSLHHYLHVLMNAGLNSYCIYKCDLFMYSPRWREWENKKHASDNPLDQEFRERHFLEFLPPSMLAAEEVDRRFNATCLPLKACVLCVLSGWLCYGPKIAEDFHEFCKVFKFLAWVGATF